jgi:hypothetical protein
MGLVVRSVVGIFCFLRGLMVFSMWYNANSPGASYRNPFNHETLFCCVSDKEPCRPFVSCSIRAEDGRLITLQDIRATARTRVAWIAFGFANFVCGALVVFNKHPIIGAVVGALLNMMLQPVYQLPDTLVNVTTLRF